MDRKNGQRNGGNEITATLPRSAVTAIGANGRRRSNYKLPSIGRSVLRDRRFAFRVSRFPFPVSRFPSRNNLFVLGFDGRFSKNEERVG